MSDSLLLSSVLLLLYTALADAFAPSGPWDAFNYAPESRVVRPVSVFKSGGTISEPSSLNWEMGPVTLSRNGSFVSLDFGKEVRLIDLLLTLWPNSMQTGRGINHYEFGPSLRLKLFLTFLHRITFIHRTLQV